MRKSLQVLMVLFGFWSVNVVADMNIAILNSGQAILESDEAKTLWEAASKEMQREADELRDMAKTMQDQQNKLKTDGEVMSATEKRKIEKEIEDAQIDIQFRQQKLQKEVQDRRQEIVQQIGPRFQKILNDIIAVDQIDLILPVDALVYFNPKHNITKRVTEKLNENKD